MQQPLAYGIKDFAALAGIGQTTIFKMIKAGELKAVKIRGRTLIPATEATRLIEGAL